MTVPYLSDQELQAALDDIVASPDDGGRVKAIVARPATDERRTSESAHFSVEAGVAGDRWAAAGGQADQQVSLVNSRLLHLLAGGDEERMAQAGDNLVVDLDLSDENLPPGQRLRVGDALLEMTAAPHTGCDKFAARFGRDATRFINAAARKNLHLRGRYARVIEAGTVRVGDEAWKVGGA
jgi:MOSC domain-containing protein YiiM